MYFASINNLSRFPPGAAIPYPTPKASHQALGIALILATLPILISRQINFWQWRPATHPCVDLWRALIAGQRLQPVDVVAT